MAYETLGIQFEVKGLTQFKSEMAQAKAAIDGQSKAATKAAPSIIDMAKAYVLGMFTFQAAVKVLKEIAQFMTDCADAAAANQTAMMHLNTTLISSGRNAEISAEGIAKIATGLMEMSSFDDEAIIDAFNAMAKFESIETGDMEKVVKVAMDMTVALGGDLAQNANDIARVLETGLIPRSWGFTAALKEQVKQLIEAGKSGEALDIILNQLNKRYGGQAQAELETYAGKVKQVKVAWGEFQESLGRAVLPALEALADETLNVIKTATLLVEWGNKVDDAYKEHINTIAKTSQSYEEYYHEAVRSALATKGLAGSVDNTINAYKTFGWSVDDVAKNFKFLTQAEWEQQKELNDSERTFKLWGKTASSWIDLIVKKFPGIINAAQSMKTDWKKMLDIGLEAADEYTKYASGMSEANEKLIQDQQTLSDLMANGEAWSRWPDNAQKIRDATDAVNADKQAIIDLNTAHRNAISEMIVGWFQLKLAADGMFDEADMKAVLDMKLAFGLLSRDAYNAAMDMIILADGIDKLPKQSTASLDFFWVTWYTQHGTPPSNAPVKFDYATANVPKQTAEQLAAQTAAYNKSQADYIASHYRGYAAGGAFKVPSGYNQDDYMARFSSGELVMAFTKAQQRAMAAPMRAMGQSNYTRNVEYNYNPTYGSAPNNPSFDFAIMQARGEA